MKKHVQDLLNRYPNIRRFRQLNMRRKVPLGFFSSVYQTRARGEYGSARGRVWFKINPDPKLRRGNKIWVTFALEPHGWFEALVGETTNPHILELLDRICKGLNSHIPRTRSKRAA